ncbi:SMP-30/gluconolactonase/LRE family protein [Rhodovarius crocodyli]|uniref:SMP-30/gluconolactonase/LRE family protein n=1 Tax=Rhodovarius crocodyli TaxID=1979269 RepID=A0A437LYV4_9PROT|nr:SMP-30/gluconolactonase/LRE family protein [Rhodovarius crocodyli]RVT90600.1 SMP-30/gluconolactonase/LRE family protein [Rhodovarius crocodyli]
MSETMDFRLVLDLQAGVAESPLWDAARDLLWLCDIPARRLLAYAPSSARVTEHRFPEVVASLGLCRSGRLVVAQKRSVLLFDPETGRSEPLAELDDEPDCNRLNDGKVGPDGHFWVGSMNNLPDKTPSGALYRISPSGKVERKLEGFTISNGLAWSPDGTRLYHADTRGPWIDTWDFDATRGEITNRRRLATVPNEEGRPDGGACDAQGNYWSAGASAGCINVFTPTGALARKLAFPVPAPTMPCFAGPGLDTLFVTSLREGKPAEMLQAYPAMGGLFRLDGVPAGSPVALFDA